MNETHNSTIESTSNLAKLLMYFNYVLFYLRFVLIYVLSALLELIGVGTAATIGISIFSVVITVLIVFYIVGDEDYDRSRQVLLKLGFDKTEIDNITSPDDSSYLSIIFYLATEYLFDIGCFFGLSRQFVLLYYSQSHAISFLATYQPIIFISVAWLVIWLANIKYGSIASKIARQNIIFEKVNLSALSNIEIADKKFPNHILLSSIIALSISFTAFVGMQYYLSGSLNISNPYSISLFVFTLFFSSMLSYVFWGQNKSYRSMVWSSFMAVSGTMGVMFFGRIALMALFGHLSSDFYYCTGVSIFIGLAVGVGVVYSQILQSFHVKEYKISYLEAGLNSSKLELNKTSSNGDYLAEIKLLDPVEDHKEADPYHKGVLHS
jgi:hypothetical protein